MATSSSPSKIASGAKDGRSRRESKIRENQVFVRNLSYDVTEEALTTAFQDIGPVKHVALTLDPETKKPKGFGFITFSLPEDAAMAVQKMNGKFLKGRDMKLELYVRKGKDEEGKEKGEKDKERNSGENKRKRDDSTETSKGPQSTATTASISASSASINASSTTTFAKNNSISASKLSSSSSSSSDFFAKSKLSAPSEKNKTKLEAPRAVNIAEKVGGGASATAQTASAVTSAPSSSSGNLNIPGKKLQLLVAGLPTYVNKYHFRKIISKISRKTMVELVKEDHYLSPLLSSLIYPWGRIMLLTCPSKKDVEKVTEALGNANLKSLGLLEQPSADVDKTKGGSSNKMKGDSSDDDSDDEDNGGGRDDVKEGAADQYDVPDMQEGEGSSPTYTGREKLVIRNVSDITSDELGQRKQKCRVIIRNLSFQANELNIALKLGQYGPLVEVLLPKIEVEQSKDNKFKRARQNNDGVKLKPRGFAFATFLCEKDARLCIQKSAADPILKICNREVAIDYSENKHEYNKKNANESGDAIATDKDAFSDEKLKSHKKDFGDDDNEAEENDDDNASEKDESGDNDMEQDVDDELDDIDDDEDDDDDDDGDDDDDEEEDSSNMKTAGKEKDKKQPMGDDVAEEKTIFVRDLPFDAESRDLIMAFKQFGRIEMALPVTDKVTGNSKGIAFVKFNFKSSAEKAIEFFNSGKQIFVMDRVVKVNLAVSRDQSVVLTNNSRKITTKDKRNLYLANEGLNMITNLSKEEKDRLDKAQNDKKKKLTSPLFFVSPTRLSIRNIPRTIDDADLKHICLRAAKLGLDKRLVSDRDMKSQLVARGETIDPKSQVPIPHLNTKGVKAKIMLDTTSKKLPYVSKGFGFVEFSDHIHALACLRELSQYGDIMRYKKKDEAGAKKEVRFTDPKVKAGNRVLVDFSVENIRKVQVIEGRKNKTSATDAKTGGGSNSNYLAAVAAGEEGEEVDENNSIGVKRKHRNNDQNDDDGDDDGDDNEEETKIKPSKGYKKDNKRFKKGEKGTDRGARNNDRKGKGGKGKRDFKSKNNKKGKQGGRK